VRRDSDRPLVNSMP